MKKIILTLMSLLTFAGLSAGISGTYCVEGVTPDKIPYTGVLSIQRNDHIYTLNWIFPDGSQDVGTGLRVGDQLSIVFQGSFLNIEEGVQVYTIKCKDKLAGPWTNAGGTNIGFETITKCSS